MRYPRSRIIVVKPKWQCVAQCEQFNSLPPTADELFSLLWGSGASLSIATSFNPSWVASSLVDLPPLTTEPEPNHKDLFGGIGEGVDVESKNFH